MLDASLELNIGFPSIPQERLGPVLAITSSHLVLPLYSGLWACISEPFSRILRLGSDCTIKKKKIGDLFQKSGHYFVSV